MAAAVAVAASVDLPLRGAAADVFERVGRRDEVRCAAAAGAGRVQLLDGHQLVTQASVHRLRVLQSPLPTLRLVLVLGRQLNNHATNNFTKLSPTEDRRPTDRVSN